MTLRVHFVLVAEGTSDHALVQPLQRLLVLAGADEASGVAPDLASLPKPPGKTVAAQVDMALKLEPTANAVFVHRDADLPTSDMRRAQVTAAVAHVSPQDVVPVIPVQETEAWLLTNEDSIREAAGHPTGRAELRLPALRRIEQTANPKERLESALIAASGLSGRRLDRFKRHLPRHRTWLLETLDVTGPVRQLTAWAELEQDVADLVEGFRKANETG